MVCFTTKTNKFPKVIGVINPKYMRPYRHCQLEIISNKNSDVTISHNDSTYSPGSTVRVSGFIDMFRARTTSLCSQSSSGVLNHTQRMGTPCFCARAIHSPRPLVSGLVLSGDLAVVNNSRTSGQYRKGEGSQSDAGLAERAYQ